jgi:hypothetical protein
MEEVPERARAIGEALLLTPRIRALNTSPQYNGPVCSCCPASTVVFDLRFSRRFCVLKG